jgi:hypothetical protein
MDDSGTMRPAPVRKGPAMCKEGVHQSAACPAGAGVDDHPTRLVDNQDISVFEEDVESCFLWEWACRSPLRQADL